MADIVLRATKGSELSHAEMDSNFNEVTLTKDRVTTLESSTPVVDTSFKQFLDVREVTTEHFTTFRPYNIKPDAGTVISANGLDTNEPFAFITLIGASTVALMDEYGNWETDGYGGYSTQDVNVNDKFAMFITDGESGVGLDMGASTFKYGDDDDTLKFMHSYFSGIRTTDVRMTISVNDHFAGYEDDLLEQVFAFEIINLP